MSKDANQLTDEQKIENFRKDLKTAKSRLLNEYVLASTTQKIDIKNETYQALNTKLLDPKSTNEISFASKEKDITKAAETASKNSTDKDLFNKFLNTEMPKFRQDLVRALSTTEGMIGLMEDKIAQDLIIQNSPFNQQKLQTEQIQNLTMQGMSVLADKINVTELLSKENKNYLLNSYPNQNLSTINKNIINTLLVENFSIEGKITKGRFNTFDTAKLTEANIQKFGQQLNNDLTSSAIIKSAIDKSQNLNPAIGTKDPARIKKNEELTKQVLTRLTPVLSGLGSEYLSDRIGLIRYDISKGLDNTKNLSSKDLDKIAKDITDKHLNQSLTQEFNKSISPELSRLDDKQFLTGLNDLIKQNETLTKKYGGNISKETYLEMPANKLAEIRRENSSQFDKIVLGKNNSVSQGISNTQANTKRTAQQTTSRPSLNPGLAPKVPERDDLDDPKRTVQQPNLPPPNTKSVVQQPNLPPPNTKRTVQQPNLPPRRNVVNTQAVNNKQSDISINPVKSKEPPALPPRRNVVNTQAVNNKKSDISVNNPVQSHKPPPLPPRPNVVINTAIAEAVMNQAIKDGFKGDEKLQKNIKTAITNTLQKFDGNYLSQNQDKLISDISKEMKSSKNQTLLSRFQRGYNLSEDKIPNIVRNIESTHSLGMTKAAKPAIATETGKQSINPTKNITPISKEAQPMAMTIIAEAEKQGVKLNPRQLPNLVKTLEQDLSKKGNDQYLANNRDKLVKEFSSNIVVEQKNTSKSSSLAPRGMEEILPSGMKKTLNNYLPPRTGNDKPYPPVHNPNNRNNKNNGRKF